MRFKLYHYAVALFALFMLAFVPLDMAGIASPEYAGAVQAVVDWALYYVKLILYIPVQIINLATTYQLDISIKPQSPGEYLAVYFPIIAIIAVLYAFTLVIAAVNPSWSSFER